MKKTIFTCTLLFLGNFVNAQINPADSTVQVVGFWEKGEKQSYSVRLDKFKKQGNDTTLRERITYGVDITIQDSTKDSYTIEWYYRNITANLSDPMMNRLVRLNENTKIRIRTDELGTLQEVLNWEELRDHIRNGIKRIRNEFNADPNVNAILAKLENQYITKDAIEAGAIRDIQQYYTYHGARYLLGETLTGKTQVANMFGGNPFDTDLIVYLDEINVEENNSILRSVSTINSAQLTEATILYLNTIAKETGGKLLKREDIQELTNETLTASRIHGSGWIIYSIETKTVTSDNYHSIEERIIEIK